MTGSFPADTNTEAYSHPSGDALVVVHAIAVSFVGVYGLQIDFQVPAVHYSVHWTSEVVGASVPREYCLAMADLIL